MPEFLLIHVYIVIFTSWCFHSDLRCETVNKVIPFYRTKEETERWRGENWRGRIITQNKQCVIIDNSKRTVSSYRPDTFRTHSCTHTYWQTLCCLAPFMWGVNHNDLSHRIRDYKSYTFHFHSVTFPCKHLVVKINKHYSKSLW